MRSKLRSLAYPLGKHPELLGLLCFVVLLGLVLNVLFYSRPINFSYGGNNCFRDPTLMPRIYKNAADPRYELDMQPAVSVKGYPIYSSKTCIKSIKPPLADKKQKASLYVSILPKVGKNYTISSNQFPKLDTKNLEGKISIREPLKIGIDQADKTFTYHLTSDKQSVTCDQKDLQLYCDVSKLGLAQGQQYALRVERFFGDTKVEKIQEKSVITVEPVVVTATSVAPGGTVYDSPSEITITTNKPLVSANIDLVVKNTGQVVEHTTVIKDNLITLKLAKPLARKTEFSINLKDAVAQDKGALPAEQKIPFASSGGPKVAAVNIGRISVDPGRTVAITFDQPLLPAQNIAKQVSFTSGATVVDFAVSISGRQLMLTPKTPLPVCATFVIKLSGEIVSNYSIGGDSAWSMSSRLKCYTVSAIGYSAQGRPINAWRFGSGGDKTLFVGNMHGDEKSSKYLMDSWVQELEAHAERIPAGKTVIVIPSVNPDGFAASTRKNGRGIDLNRNFPTNDWKPDVKMPGGEFAVGGGGATPLSEPESQSLSNFTLAERPSLVLTYHSQASVVSPNGVGSSGDFAALYSRLSGYRNLPKTDSSTIFQYDITGAFEDWLYDRIGIPALLVELGSHTNSDFVKNKTAMWRMIQ